MHLEREIAHGELHPALILLYKRIHLGSLCATGRALIIHELYEDVRFVRKGGTPEKRFRIYVENMGWSDSRRRF